MEIQNYNQCYEQAVVDLWNACPPCDPLTLQKFRKQALLDDNFDPSLCYVAMADEKVVGFLLATRRKFPYLERGTEPDRGWINVLFVEAGHRRQGIGRALVERAEADMKARGAKNVTVAAYSPNYFFPGIDKQNYPESAAFFDAMGYQSGEESYSMCKDLHGYQLDEAALARKAKAEAAGFRFIPFSWKYCVDLLEFAKVEFGGGWKRNLLISMQNNLAEDNVLLCVDQNDQLAGFCMRQIDGNPMRFGPIGVMASQRNWGLGSILLDLMQLEMEKRGIYHMYFVSTDAPGRRFYERHGITVFRTFTDYRKNLD